MFQELDDEKLVLAFLGRPKEKEEKRNFVIKEKPTHELTVKTPEPVLTSKMAIKEVVQEISENYELIRGAKIFETFAWHLVMHRTFCLDHLLVNEISTQKKLFSTYDNPFFFSFPFLPSFPCWPLLTYSFFIV